MESSKGFYLGSFVFRIFLFPGSQTHRRMMLWDQRASCNWQQRMDFFPWQKFLKIDGLMVVEIRPCKNIKVFYQSGIHDKIGDVFQTTGENISDGLDFSDWRQIPLENISALLLSYMPINPIWAELGEKPAVKVVISMKGGGLEVRSNHCKRKSQMVRHLQDDYHSDWQHHWRASPWSTPSQLWLLKTQSDDFFHFGARPIFRGCVFDLPRFLYKSVDFASRVIRKSS